ncbi:unnamed protein product [Paramecium pentaurelia]|uniref:Uncharacterized protein n=1 Tax=Paramecium pentaurelia TaxID=43138 RepID=A0A8S1WC64_9CILI|nr:unnamed protein product [Paramecium pentaurelia]
MVSWKNQRQIRNYCMIIKPKQRLKLIGIKNERIKNKESRKQKETCQTYKITKQEKVIAGQTLNTQQQIYINEKNQEQCSQWNQVLNIPVGIQSFLIMCLRNS